MRYRLAVAATFALTLSACASQSSAPPATGPTPTATGAAPSPASTTGPTPIPTLARNPAPVVEGQPYVQTIDPAMFVGGVDNPFFPMVRGAGFVFDGAEHVEVNVEVGGKEILGVYTTIVRDKVFVDGELVEDTSDWYAQDTNGNVWYFGEQTAEYENGEVTSTAGSWEAGVDGAQPGIVMLADPQVGDRYRQEYLAGEAEDLAEITATTGSIQSGAGSWSGADVLVTEEWTPLEPGVRERKTYARGVGVVEVRTIEGGDEVTTLTSTTLTTTGSPPEQGPSTASLALLPLLLGVAVAGARRRLPGVRSRLVSNGETTSG
jgi:hypothetical protein